MVKVLITLVVTSLAIIELFTLLSRIAIQKQFGLAVSWHTHPGVYKIL